MGQKRQWTFSIDSDTKLDFQIEVLKNGGDMSNVIEDFMKNYIKASKALRNSAEENPAEENPAEENISFEENNSNPHPTSNFSYE